MNCFHESLFGMVRTPKCYPPKDKAGMQRNYGRLHELKRSRRGFHSGFIRCRKDNKSIKRNLYKLCHSVWHHYLQDDLKAPMNNGACPAHFSKPATNIYFAVNKNDDGENMEVASYGFGSGGRSIGLNPRTMKIHPTNAVVVKLMEKVTQWVKKFPRWADQMNGKSFDSVNGKVYHAFRHLKNRSITAKDVNWHTDVTYQGHNQPKNDNSQLPGTPAVILCFGHPKNLWFRQHTSPSHYSNTTLLYFRQGSCSMFVVDPEDENPDPVEGWHWRHMSDMQDGNEDAITFSFVFRVTNMTTKVNKMERTQRAPKLGDLKQEQYDVGEAIYETAVHKEELEMLTWRMENFFQEFKP